MSGKNITDCGEMLGVGPALPASQLSLERLPHPLVGGFTYSWLLIFFTPAHKNYLFKS
jgi:hypothetical protein